MLVLTRKIGERVVIDENVVITIVELRRGRVRLGIEAPPQVNVLRQELQDRQAAGHAKAAAGGAGKCERRRGVPRSPRHAPCIVWIMGFRHPR
jgi:carbon storage regulator